MECKERLVCDGAQAVYKCDDCESVQCSECLESLHGLTSIYRKHNMSRLDVPLCKGPCNPKQQAAMLCTVCKAKLCQSCDEKVHSGRRSGHERVAMDDCVSTASAESAARANETRALGVDVQTSAVKVPLNRKETATSQIQEVNDTKRREEVQQVKPPGDSPPQASDLLISFDSLTPLTAAHANSQHSTNLDLLGWDSNAVDHLTSATPAVDTAARPTVSSSSPDQRSRDCQSLLLVNEQEQLMVDSVEELVTKLDIDPSDCVKVVSIIGNTGDGKSHTLNQAFFNGRNIFCTSPHQATCTIGVWCAYDPNKHLLFLDTEGMLGSTSRQKERTRLLLKILAISDIVIYRTRAERLHNDMYHFLSTASQSYKKFFASELAAVSETLKLDKQHCGPIVIIFHETTHTVLLGQGEFPQMTSKLRPSNASKLLRQRFDELKQSPDAFSALHYIGTRTQTEPTDFKTLTKAVTTLAHDNSVRSPRRIEVVYQSLLALNSKFSHTLPNESPVGFADEYFTCQQKCLVCEKRCSIPMNHEKDDIPHEPQGNKPCLSSHDYDNKTYICQTCYNDRGKKQTVLPKSISSKDSNLVGLMKYAWSGYILECPQCGIIYRSRQNWFGTTLGPNEAGAVRTEYQHVWNKSEHSGQGTHNAARRLIETVSTAATSMGRLTAPAASAMSEWVNDKVAPSYWVPNSQLKACHMCNIQFNSDATKHHCRACGRGFCYRCSSKSYPVPSHGWGDTPVRVCDKCFEKLQKETETDTKEGVEGSQQSGECEPAPADVMARKVTEVVRSAVGVVATAVGYSKELITDSARPEYWVPDADITNCTVCNTEFTEKASKHHCRSCGKGVCDKCSSSRYPVPSRGWDEEVRVCDTCVKKNYGNKRNSKGTD